MTAITYPVAPTADAALHAPVGFAEREREARLAAAGEVEFVTEAVGPAFATREAALDAYAGRIDDERPGRIASALETRWCQLRAVSTKEGAKPARRKPLRPAFRDGRRWPSPDPARQPETLWRLSVSYWRVVSSAVETEHAPARKLRRDAAGKALDAMTLEALARQPLRPARTQQALDIGLFEYRLPENPAVIVPDE